MNLQLFGGFYPFNPNLGQVIQTNVRGLNVDASFIAHVSYSATEAVDANTTGVHNAITASGDVVVTVDDEFKKIPVARNITVTAGGVEANIGAVSVTVTGLNLAGEEITEDIGPFTAGTSGTKVGNKAFKEVTKVEIPAMTGTGVTIAVGYGSKLGLPYKLAHNTCLVTYLNNVIESTDAALTVDATKLEENTITLSSTLNGTVVDTYLIV